MPFVFLDTHVLSAVVIFVFGTIIGSFLNALSFRYGSGWSFNNRSQCMTCGKILGPLELVPVVSFLALKGRCLICKSKISIQYPLVELLTGVLFVLIGLKTGVDVVLLREMVPFLLYAFVFSVLMLISVYDVRHKIIPDGLVVCFAIVAAGLSWYIHAGFDWPSYAAGFGMAFAIFLLWFLSRGRAIGLGDAKLALGIGLLLGVAEGLSALAVGFWSGALVSVLLLVLGRIVSTLPGIARLSLVAGGLTMKSEIPLAPFLIFGTFLSWYLGLDVFQINAFFS